MLTFMAHLPHIISHHIALTMNDVTCYPPSQRTHARTHARTHRIIDGVVRKWMGSQPAPVRRNFAATMRSGAKVHVPRETERLDPTDTGVMATRRLAPFVSEEEEGEYQRYC